MAKFDQEDLLDSVYSILTSNNALNTKIAAIDAEKIAKGKGLTPALKPVAAYYQQSWSDKILSTNPAVFYGVEDVQAVESGSALAKTYKIFIEVVLVDNGQTNDTHKRIARYSRALEELFSETLTATLPIGRVKIDTVRPISFKLELDSDDEIKIGGISLTITLY